MRNDRSYENICPLQATSLRVRPFYLPLRKRVIPAVDALSRLKKGRGDRKSSEDKIPKITILEKKHVENQKLDHDSHEDHFEIYWGR